MKSLGGHHRQSGQHQRIYGGEKVFGGHRELDTIQKLQNGRLGKIGPHDRDFVCQLKEI